MVELMLQEVEVTSGPSALVAAECRATRRRQAQNHHTTSWTGLMDTKMERFTFTVGKLDAGMAILIGERAHLIEFPSILLPPGVTSGSIVNISVNRNVPAEKAHADSFWSLQDSILQEYGLDSPRAPELTLRHTTQTSVTLEWPPLHLAQAKLRSLEILKNGQRLATIPNPTANTSTKLSSLQMNEEYSFQLILKTTAGTYPSNIIRIRTHTLTDTSGISVCFGTVEDPALLAEAKAALDRMGARWTDKIQIETTQFVCTTPNGPGRDGETNGESSSNGYGGAASGPTVEYQKAMQLSLPIVQPQWILACQGEKRVVSVSSYQLGTAPIQSFSTAPFTRSPQQPGSPSPMRRSSMTAAAKAQSIQRAPSPETIARMSINTSSSDSGEQRNKGLQSPGLDSPRFAESVQESARSGAGSGPSKEEPVRPKSPRPEAVGKLDRSFKFPTPPTSASADGESSAGKSQEGATVAERLDEALEEDVPNSDGAAADGKTEGTAPTASSTTDEVSKEPHAADPAAQEASIDRAAEAEAPTEEDVKAKPAEEAASAEAPTAQSADEAAASIEPSEEPTPVKDTNDTDSTAKTTGTVEEPTVVPAPATITALANDKPLDTQTPVVDSQDVDR